MKPMKQWHILTYDVRDNKRLQQLHRYLKKQGVALQRSVFLLHGTALEVAEILNGVRERVHLRKDSVHLYPVQSLASLWAVGQQGSVLPGLYAGQAMQTLDTFAQNRAA